MISKGAQQLLDIIKEIFPNQKVIMEYNIAEKGALFLDFFIPTLNLAFEYDGEFHTRFNKHFHGDRQSFLRAQKRDFEKDELCEQKGITLVRVSHIEPMTRDFVGKKIEQALQQ
ncbi:MAG: hypothetical protein ACW99Q_28295 [Candidatus Kariarchaeaceae archaeon]|jgi:very-short-patch-repair endonuclease